MKRAFLVLGLAMMVSATGCESNSNYTYVESDYGQSFQVKNVSWTQDLSEHGKTLRWAVEFKNDSGFNWSGPRGIGIQFVGSTKGVTAELSSSGFIEKIGSKATDTIRGEIITDQIPDHATIRFIE